MLSQFFTSLDIFGVPGILYLSGKEKSKCLFGGISSLLFFSFAIWALYTGIKELSNTTNPQTVESELYGQDAREFIISPSTFPISIRVNYLSPESKIYKSFIDPRIYNITVGVRIYHYGQYMGIEKLPIEKCKPKHFGDMYSAFISPDLENSSCLSQDQVSIQGVFGSPVYRDLIILIYQCDNITSNGNCAPQEEIDAYLKESWFEVVYGNMVIDPSNYLNPDRRYQDYYAVMLTETTSQNSTIKLRHLNVMTDSAWIGESWSRQDFIRVNDIRENSAVKAKTDAATPLLTCLFEMGLLETNYTRSYKKIQTVIAEVAGVVNTVLAIFVILISGYLRLKVNETMINELFDINMSPKVSKGKTKRKNKNKHNQNKQQFDLNNSGDQGKLKADLSSFEKTSNELPENREHQNLSDIKHSETSVPVYGKTQDRNDITHDSKKEEIASQPQKMTPKKASSLKTFSENRKEIKGYIYSDKHLAGNKPSPISIPSNAAPSFLQEEGRRLEALNKKRHLLSEKEDMVKVEMKILEEPEIESYDYEKSILCPESPGNVSEMKQMEINDKIENISTEKRKDPIPNQEIRSSIKDRENDEKPDASIHLHRRSSKTALCFWEYLLSFVYEPQNLKHKMQVLNEGEKNISCRLDVLHILKKMREIDKIKALLFDKEQLILFNNLPKPEIGLGHDDSHLVQAFPTRILMKKTNLTEELGTEKEVLDSYGLLKQKENKTEIDKKLLEVFYESLHPFEEHNLEGLSPKYKTSSYVKA